VTREPYSHPNDDHGDAAQRTLERACDAALFGDTPSAEDALEARAAGLDLAREVEAFEVVAAQLEAERMERASEDEIPAHLRARLLRLADSAAKPVVATPAPLPFTRPQAPNRSPMRDRLIAAACIAFGAASTFALLRAGRETPQEFPTDPARFVSMYPSAVRWPWTPTEDDHVVGEVRGEAIFDPTTSKGLLVIEGLAANDPTLEQYQLWIFDASRDDRFPVDGGVFDVPADGRAVIPVAAKLSVDKPTLFAVTIEKPGGVVVSDRRIAILAKP
jgi:anti-sigma-K factor RskA